MEIPGMFKVDAVAYANGEHIRRTVYIAHRQIVAVKDHTGVEPYFPDDAAITELMLDSGHVIIIWGSIEDLVRSVDE